MWIIMQSTIKLMGIIIIGVFIFFSCVETLTGPDPARGELPRNLTVSEIKVISADHRFSYELFRRSVNSESGENVVISPLSVSMALSMVLNGAENETYVSMRNALKFEDITLDEINEGYQSITDLLVNLDMQVDFYGS